MVKQELHRQEEDIEYIDSKIPANPPLVIQKISFIRPALMHVGRHVTKFPARLELVSTMINFESYGGH